MQLSSHCTNQFIALSNRLHNPTVCAIQPNAPPYHVHHPTCAIQPIAQSYHLRHPTDGTYHPTNRLHHPTTWAIQPFVPSNRLHHHTTCTILSVPSNPTVCAIQPNAPPYHVHHPTCAIQPIAQSYHLRHPTDGTYHPTNRLHHPTTWAIQPFVPFNRLHHPTTCAIQPIVSTIQPTDSTMPLAPSNRLHYPTTWLTLPFVSSNRLHHPTTCAIQLMVPTIQRLPNPTASAIQPTAVSNLADDPIVDTRRWIFIHRKRSLVEVVIMKTAVEPCAMFWCSLCIDARTSPSPVYGASLLASWTDGRLMYRNDYPIVRWSIWLRFACQTSLYTSSLFYLFAYICGNARYVSIFTL